MLMVKALDVFGGLEDQGMRNNVSNSPSLFADTILSPYTGI